MATRKKAGGKQMATMEDLQARMAEKAGAVSSREEAPGGNTISTRNGKFSLGGDELGDTMDVIVLGFAHLNTYYDTPYDKENPTPPECFAIGMEGKGLTPHENGPEPQDEGEGCDACWANQFGSAERGRGKACKNQRRLVVMENVDELETAELAVMTLPVSSLKNWRGYIRELEKMHHRPPEGVITRFTFEDAEDYEYPVAELAETIDDPERLQATMERAETKEVEELLLRPYTYEEAEEEPKPAPRRKAGGTKKKAVTKKKATRRKR